MALNDDHLVIDPSTGDQLYERWRTGLIKRHICADGKLDENTFIILRDDQAGLVREDFSRRRGMETWTGVNEQESNTGQPIEKIWWPIGMKSKEVRNDEDLLDKIDFKLAMGESFGGGDNPLLSGGWALAVFSMEAEAGFPHSIRYAYMLFNYIASCEASPGFFRRRTGHKIKDASTDELLGIVIGLQFYCKALRTLGRTSELSAVVGLASRLGKNLERHGYWLLPDSVDYDRYYGQGQTPNLNNQRTYVFAHPIRQALKFITGETYDAKWNEGEFVYYFGYSLYDPRRYILFPPPKFGFGAYLEAEAVKKLNVSKWNFFKTFLAGFSGAKTITETLSNILDGAVGLLDEIGIDTSLDLSPPTLDNVKNFNCVMISEACIMLLELYSDNLGGFSNGRADRIAKTINAIRSLNLRSENSFYAIVNGMALRLQNKQLGDDLIRVISHVENPAKWQHDLPLGRIKLLEYLYTDTDPTDRDEKKFVDEARGWLDLESGIANWKARMQSRSMPFDYNWQERWGDRRCWELLDSNRNYASEWSAQRSVRGEGPDYKKFLTYYFENGCREIKIEACGLDMLFGRALSGHWRLLNFPSLQSYDLWATAPYTEKKGLYNTRYTANHHLLKLIHNEDARIAARPRFGRYDNRSVKLFQPDRNKFSYRRWTRGVRGFIDFNKYWIGWPNGSVLGGDGRYNGRRVFNYDLNAEYFVDLKTDELDIIQQIGKTRIKVENARWDKAWLNANIIRLGGTLLLRGDKWRGIEIVRHIPSTSFYFYRSLVRKKYYGSMPANWSVGNEFLIYVGKVWPYIRRIYSVDEVDDSRRFILNPHTGVIHDIQTLDREHFSVSMSTGNALLLPIKSDYNIRALDQDELQIIMNNIFSSGSPSTVELGVKAGNYELQRRDDYRLPWDIARKANRTHFPYPRMADYISADSLLKRDYEQKNSRAIRLCTICFRHKPN